MKNYNLNDRKFFIQKLFVSLLIVLFFSSPAWAVCREGCASNNTFLGDDALVGIERGLGSGNTAIGFQALFACENASLNTGVGEDALRNTSTGVSNTAIGGFALNFNTSGKLNTASGAGALMNNMTGNNNTAIGTSSLTNNTSGSNNIALGESAGTALTTGSNNIDIGNAGGAGESGKIRIGTKGTHTSTFIAGISGTTVSGGVGVVVGINGKLGTIISSARFKDDIRAMDKESEAILALKPVTFYYKHEFDSEHIPQFGLVAEDVEKVNSDLVVRDDEGRPQTVRYEAVNAMLLNEFLKAHRKSLEQEATIAQLKSAVADQKTIFESAIARQQEEIQRLAVSLKEQAAQVRNVSDRLQMNEPAPRVAVDN